MARISAQRLRGLDFGLAWSNHGSMAQIAAQWLRGSDLEMVLARDLSSVVQWLGSISAHENRIKKKSHKRFSFFFFLFFFFLLAGQCQFSHFFFFFLKFRISKFEI
jgi:hypothetical protein